MIETNSMQQQKHPCLKSQNSFWEAEVKYFLDISAIGSLYHHDRLHFLWPERTSKCPLEEVPSLFHNLKRTLLDEKLYYMRKYSSQLFIPFRYIQVYTFLLYSSFAAMQLDIECIVLLHTLTFLIILLLILFSCGKINYPRPYIYGDFSLSCIY